MACVKVITTTNFVELKIEILLKLFNHANIKDLEYLCVCLMCYDEYSIL